MMRNQILFISLLFLTTLSYQACNKPLFSGSTEDEQLKTESNGEGYSGKPTPYDFSLAQRPCQEVGANGRPLPNRQIFLFPSGQAQVVREECQDVAPKSLSASEFQMTSDGNIIYQNQVFQSNLNQGDFDVVAAACPAGRTAIPNATRSSLLQDPLNLLSSVWYGHEGVVASIDGSLGSLPLYQLTRNDPRTLERWRRFGQGPSLVAGESYVYSFFAKPNSTNRALLISYLPNVQDFELEFDLTTGAVTFQMTSGVILQDIKTQMFAGGLYVNVYFQSLGTGRVDLGITPRGEYLGSSISLTAVQLERVSDFCAP